MARFTVDPGITQTITLISLTEEQKQVVLLALNSFAAETADSRWEQQSYALIERLDGK